MNYKIAANAGTIITRQGRTCVPGDEVTSEEIGAAEKEFLRDRKIFRAGITEIAPIAPAPTGPTSETVVLDSDGTLKPKAQIDARLTSNNEKPATLPQRLTGIWTCPVDTLVNKSLEELNAMVMERDNTIPPFDDKNEAIAQLSMDVPPAK